MSTGWTRRGLIIPRAASGDGSDVVGDPCIVWDDDIRTWRMIHFSWPPGTGEAVCDRPEDPGPGSWRVLGPLRFTNPEALSGGYTHKPFVVMEATRPNRAARVDGRFHLVTVSSAGGSKVVQRCSAENLSGPWTVEEGLLIPTGGPGAFDEKHVDAVTGFWFEDRQEFLYFYMGYPKAAQSRAVSPFGSASAVAVQDRLGGRVRKLGIILPPDSRPGHWAGGWIGGVQLLPATGHYWEAVVNASPTAPLPSDTGVAREEPAPSLGGIAHCDEAWPVRGWEFEPVPIERIGDIPVGAIAAGEGTNLWRQHILVLPNGRRALYYNSGSYGKEQLYMKEQAG